MKEPKERIEGLAKHFKPGYLESVMRIATEKDGFLLMDAGAYDAVYQAFKTPLKVSGLGSLIRAVIHPVAVATDALLGTHLEGCPGCQERAAKLDGKG